MIDDERNELLDLYGDLRVADVRDGMDWMGMHPYGSMAPSIRPLWRTRAVGIARTARYLPYEGPVPRMTPDEYTEWVSWYYRTVCTYPWMDAIQRGDFIVIDASGVDAGLMGSNNALAGIAKGARGYVSSGGCRDTDEVIGEKIPFWAAVVSQSMVQARLRFDAMDVPVAVGGVAVYPGDVVVADGDGVIVVPQALARDVARYARRELDKDKTGRRKLYEQVGLPLDDTVR
ncbi:MAG: RraA family protein [Planctomycetes bacterium]|nr:RraA family protein [Planctomycetota bacterium]